MIPAMPDRAEIVVAAFDLDGTLTNGGSVFSWLRTVAGTKAAMTTALRMSPRLGLAALKGGTRADSTKEELFVALLRGRPLAEIAEISASYGASHVSTRLRTDVKARLDDHLAAGHRVVIVSASPELYVKSVGEILGAHGVVATRMAIDPSGLLTGRYEGKNCRGAEKFSRVTSWMRSEGLLGSSEQTPTLWAYGNSRGDLRLLRAANHGVSCAKLGQLSRLSQFPSLAEVVTAPVSKSS